MGGEEFLVLTHNTNEAQAAKVAENFRQEVEESELLVGRNVTLSAGVSGLEEGMDSTTWLRACDDKLYRAKEAGRNCIVV